MRYQMQAVDSQTGALFTWVTRDEADWDGSGYPGPNEPTEIAVAAEMTRPGGGSSWGIVREVTDAAVAVSADDVNAGLLLKAGRAGVQELTLPTSGITEGAAVLVVAFHAAVSATNKVTVVGPTQSVELTELDAAQGFVWVGRWVKV